MFKSFTNILYPTQNLSNLGNITNPNLVFFVDANTTYIPDTSTTTWFDGSGNGYNFTLTNSPVFTTHSGSACFNFSGTNDYAVYNGSLRHDFATEGSLTIVIASIDNTNFGGCARAFSMNDVNNDQFDYVNYIAISSCSETALALELKNKYLGDSGTIKAAGDPWKIITFTWTAGVIQNIYTNGVLSQTTTANAAFNYLAVTRMAIGSNANLSRENIYARIAYLSMYNKELTATEVANQFNRMRSRYGI